MASLMSDDSRIPALCKPYKMGRHELSTRVVMAPMSRMRWTSYSEFQPHVLKYYTQRAAPGVLIITEAVAISDTSQGQPYSPAIYEPAHVEAWKPIVEAVHAKGAIFICQLWHVGRVSNSAYQPNGAPPVSSTDKKLPSPPPCMLPGGDLGDFSQPRALKTAEIPAIVCHFRDAAKNAILAGFDGVEIHGANGYLLEQFMKDGINDRTDEYGGGLEARCRFPLGVVAACAEAIGPERVGVRLSPFTPFNGAVDSDPAALGEYMAQQLTKLGILYLHCVEPRYVGRYLVETPHSLTPIRKAFKGTFIVCGGYGRADGIAVVDAGDADLVAYAKWFLANPDLPTRFLLNAPLNEFRREYFYAHEHVLGYTDYPFLNEGETDSA